VCGRAVPERDSLGQFQDVAIGIGDIERQVAATEIMALRLIPRGVKTRLELRE
jgi:hypothetical protein